MKYSCYALAAVLVMPALSARANEGPEPTAPASSEDNCLPGAGIIEALAKFDGLKPEKRDTVGPDLSLTFTLEDGAAMPDRVELRDGSTVIQVRFNETHRSIGLTDQLRQLSEAATLCVIDPARAGLPLDNRGYSMNIAMGVRFHDTPGTHSLDQIEDGLKDGRSHYKKMAGAMGFLVPKFDYIAVANDDKATPPRLWATAKGVDLGEPDFELYDGARMVGIKALEDMGADGVRVAAGYYRMSPSPDAKTVAKFSGDDE